MPININDENWAEDVIKLVEEGVERITFYSDWDPTLERFLVCPEQKEHKIKDLASGPKPDISIEPALTRKTYQQAIAANRRISLFCELLAYAEEFDKNAYDLEKRFFIFHDSNTNRLQCCPLKDYVKGGPGIILMTEDTAIKLTTKFNKKGAYL